MSTSFVFNSQGYTDIVILFQAFLGPFRIKNKKKKDQINVNATDIDFEDPSEDPGVVRRVRSRLAALEEPDDEEDAEGHEDVDEVHQAALDEEVAQMVADAIVELGEMTSEQCQEAMFMLSKVGSFFFSLHFA